MNKGLTYLVASAVALTAACFQRDNSRTPKEAIIMGCYVNNLNGPYSGTLIAVDNDGNGSIDETILMPETYNAGIMHARDPSTYGSGRKIHKVSPWAKKTQVPTSTNTLPLTQTENQYLDFVLGTLKVRER